MTVTEIKQATGSWELRLRSKTPRAILEQLTYFGHIAVLPGRIDPAQFDDNLLRAARYVGVYRNRDAQDEFTIKGVGMAFWLGDEDGKGDIFESPVTLVAQTFATSVPALLPPGGAVLPGVINSVAGTYTGKHQWVTSRQALNYVTELFNAEYRVNGDATLDAGTVAQLYVTTPRAILLPKGRSGRDLLRASLAGKASMGTDVEDYTTRVVVLAEGEGTNIATGSADASVVPYKDIRGNPMKSTRLVSESETAATNADARAELALNQFSGKRYSVALSSNAFDIKGDVAVGDYVDVYDPANGFVDPTREVYWDGEPINPMALRCVEMSWPIPPEWTVAFRTVDGVWIDLSQYYAGETGETTLVVGDFNKSLTGIGSEDIGSRPNLPDGPGADSTVPAAPAFTGFSTGSYQSGTTSTTKSAIRAQWSQPLNIDGSTIQDGDHYEIRYRVNAVIGYSISYDDLAAYSWDDLGTWDALISSPVSADPQWTTAYVGWDTLAYTITELTPGVQYEFQIRAVDTASPPNNGPWSASSFVLTSGDVIAPSTPAVPVVASSRIAIQLVHRLGKASGGTFNLEQDLDHLDVHVGGVATFSPDDSNKVGELIANAGMILGEIPAVGTFQVEQTDAVWVKVVAVDRAGNKSGPSEGATATVELIDSAHISDLTVSKLTTGTMTATLILAGEIATAASGQRMVMTADGLEVYNSAGYKTAHFRSADNRLDFYEPGYLNPPVEIGQTSGGTWGLRVADLFGETKVLLGQLDPSGGFGSENYGLAAVDPGGAVVPLSRLAFGPATDVIVNREGTTVTSYNDLPTFGPYVSGVEIGTAGRCIVIVGALIEVKAADGFAIRTGSGYMSYEVVGPTPSNANDGRAAAIEYRYDITTSENTTHDVKAGVSRVTLLEGLAPGTYSFGARYRTDSSGDTTYFSNRSLIVLPY